MSINKVKNVLSNSWFWIFILFAWFIAILYLSSTVKADDEVNNKEEESTKTELIWLKDNSKCPFISVVPPAKATVDVCFKCHTEGNFKLKEPDSKNEYEGKPYSLEFGYENGKLTYMYYLCDGISPSKFFEIFQYLEKHKELPRRLIIDVHNPGGAVMDTWKIIGLISRYYDDYEIETRQDGMALSAGFALFLMGEKRSCSPNAEFMWHQASYTAWLKSVSASGAQDDAENMHHIQNNIDTWIIKRTNGKITRELLSENMGSKDQEWWFNGKEAYEYGVCTELVE